MDELYPVIRNINEISSCKESDQVAVGLISRREFATYIASALAFSAVPLKGASSAEKLKVVWHGLSFMEQCTDDCANLDIAFPNIRKILKDENDAPKIWKSVTDKFKSVSNTLPIQIIVPTGANPDVGQPDVGMVLAITSETDIASRYYADDDVTLLVYEIQCYAIVFEFKKFKVMNSFPIRLWRADKISGRKNSGSLKNWIFKSLSGQGIDDGGTLPDIFEAKLKNTNFRQTDPISIRVTNVEVRKMMNGWVSQQNRSVKEIKSLAGNSLTSAISETINIGVQPYSVNKSLGDLAITLSTSGASADIFNTLDLRDPDLDIRLALRGVIVKVKKKDEHFNTYRISIGVEISAGKYEYEFDRDGVGKELIKETLIEPILKQNLRAISIEVATGEWRNDWYWVLDLHHALFEWFFSSIMDPAKSQKMIKGHQRKGKTRKWLFQVHSKDADRFEKEASLLRERLRPN
jgi:hypothetical protein